MATTIDQLEALTSDFNNLSPYTGPLTFKFKLFEDEKIPARPVPRYLFRVFSRKSAGHTSETVVRSKAACSQDEKMKESARTCLFRKDKALARDMVLRHLMWCPKDDDNLVSWTSSILFAIVYMFYHHIHYGIATEDVYICIIDTKKFAEKTFICDMDLIDHFRQECDKDWEYLYSLRSGKYYFGEYLSQGSRVVEDKCVVVPAAHLFQQGLFGIHDGFSQLKGQMQQGSRTKWASIVCDYRDKWPQNMITLEQTRAEAIVRVADLFGERWRLPVALSLASLYPYFNAAWILTSEFQETSRLGCLTKAELLDCNIATTVVVKHERLLEVNELYRNTRKMCSIFIQTSLNDAIVGARAFARESQRNKDLSKEDYQKVRRRVDEIMEILKINE